MDTKAIKANFEARTAAALELRSVYTEAAGRELSAEEVQTESRLNAAIADFDARVASGLDALADEKRTAEAFAAADLGAEAPKDEGRSVPSDADRLRAIARGELRTAEGRVGADFGAAEERGTATLVKGTAGVGGNTVPTSFYDTLVESMIEVSSVITAGATVLRTAGGEQIQIPTATAYPSAVLVGEGVQLTNSDATFGQKALDAYKYGFTMKASSELLDDSGVNIVEFLGRRGGEALGNGIGTAAFTGTGSSQPQGIIAASGGLSTFGSASGSVAAGFKYDDVLGLVHSITRPYRNGAAFITNDTTILALRKLREGSGTGQYLWQPSLVLGEQDTLAGYPILTDTAMPTAVTNGTKGLVFGNIAKAVIVRFAGPVRVESSTDFAFDTDLTVWRFIVRFDSEVVDAGAAKVMTYTT